MTFPNDFVTRARKLLESIPKYVDDIEKMNRHNKIFKMRTEGITAISAEDAIDWGFTGPVLRAVRRSLRHPEMVPELRLR